MSWVPLHVHISYSTTVFLPFVEVQLWGAGGCGAQLVEAENSWTQTPQLHVQMWINPEAKHSTFLNVNGFRALIFFRAFPYSPQQVLYSRKMTYTLNLRRENQNFSGQWFFFFLPPLFATGIFLPTHGPLDPANTRQELLCWKRKGLISRRNTSLPASTASSGLSWCSQIAVHLAGGVPLLQAELPAKRGLWWLILWIRIFPCFPLTLVQGFHKW